MKEAILALSLALTACGTEREQQITAMCKENNIIISEFKIETQTESTCLGLEKGTMLTGIVDSRWGNIKALGYTFKITETTDYKDLGLNEYTTCSITGEYVNPTFGEKHSARLFWNNKMTRPTLEIKLEYTRNNAKCNAELHGIIDYIP